MSPFNPSQRGSILRYIFSLVKSYSTLKMADFCPPSEVRGMKKLDRSLFARSINVPCLKVKCETVHPLIKVMKSYLLKLPNFKPIREVNEDETTPSPTQIVNKEVFLNPKLISSLNDIKADDRELLSRLGIDETCLNLSILQITYDNFTADEIFSAVLPKGKDIAAGYSLVGHIVHLNLREHLLEYKYLIGEVLLDKIKQARTVVNKVDTIDNTFRVFNMEVLAGDTDFITEVKERGCRFKFDFSSVYWNPRLCTEHERIVNKLRAGDVLYDVFAGVGPFSIPAAKKKCEVLANDLNPESFKWLQHNANLNKVQNLIKAFNKDGADFLRNDVKDNILEHKGERRTHIVMNLPALAVTFLYVFKQFFTADQLKQVKFLPTLHIYCFVKGDGDLKEMAKKLVESELNCNISKTVDEISFVRNVAPNKDMMRVSFQITESIILGSKRKLDESEIIEEVAKRSR